MEAKLLNDKELDLVSGGVLKEGWETTLLMMMGLYKSKYGEDGMQKVKDLMLLSLNDATSPIEPEDMDTLNSFIDENWGNA